MAVPGSDALSALRTVVGDAHVLTDPDVTASYLTDWSGAWTGSAAVVRPADTAQVSAVVALCAAHDVVVTPQGGNTGLVGGSVPAPGDRRAAIVLSSRRLTSIDDVDAVGRCVGAGAGATLAQVRAAAESAGLEFGVDLAARDSATVGGMVATNAGGIAMIRHGDMRSQVLGIEAVLPSGEVLTRWRPLRKDNVGYHLPGLLAGSEGTLAVITRVLLRLVDPPRTTAVALIGADGIRAAQRIVAQVQQSGDRLEAVEIMTRTGTDLVRASGVRSPFRTAVTLLVETASDPDALLDVLAGAPDVIDAVVEPGPARDLWALRESHTAAIARSSTTPPVKLDVAVPLGAVADLVDRVDEIAETTGVRAVQFGHLGDGNIHVNLLDVAESEQHAVARRILETVADLGGSISAEHGIGRAKAHDIDLGRDAVDIAVMRSVKTALDPNGLMNPGVIFPDRSS